MAALKPLAVHTFDTKDGNHFRVYSLRRTTDTNDQLDIETVVGNAGFMRVMDGSGNTFTGGTASSTVVFAAGTPNETFTFVVHYHGRGGSL